MRSEDTSFILKTWLNTQTKSDHYKPVAFQLYKPQMKKFIPRVLEVSTVMVLEYEGVVIGYVVSRKDMNLHVISYVYVKRTKDFDYRNQGLADLLISSAKNPTGTTLCTHNNPVLREYMRRNKIFYYPFIDYHFFERFEA